MAKSWGVIHESWGAGRDTGKRIGLRKITLCIFILHISILLSQIKMNIRQKWNLIPFTTGRHSFILQCCCSTEQTVIWYFSHAWWLSLVCLPPTRLEAHWRQSLCHDHSSISFLSCSGLFNKWLLSTIYVPGLFLSLSLSVHRHSSEQERFVLVLKFLKMLKRRNAIKQAAVIECALCYDR